MQSSEESNISKYAYTPLEDGFFRLFRIVEAGAAPQWNVVGTTVPGVNSPLRVECIVSPIGDPVCYEAISYCWAGHERSLSLEERGQRLHQDRHILVSDGELVVGYIPICASLQTAMLYLRCHTDKPLFIDQLCINQADHVEKALLVRRMGEIYTKANRVLAWLGPSDLEAQTFVSFVEHLEEAPSEAYLRLTDHDYSTLNAIRAAVTTSSLDSQPVPDHLTLDCHTLREMAIQIWDDIPLKGFINVCSRQFFGRMWIVQEACLSESLHLICGHHLWDADQFERVLLLFSIILAHRAGNLTHEDLTKAYPRIDDIIFAIAIVRFVNRIFSTRRTIHRPSQNRMTLLHLLAKFNVVDTVSALTEVQDLQKFRAGDPRDCCYSIMALPEPNDTVVKRITVSYEVSPQQVFIALAGALAVDNIDVILFSQDASKRLKGLPSWVPDWSSQLVSPFGYLQSNKPLFTAGHAIRNQDCQGESGPYVVGSTLAVTGYSVDTIHRIGDYSFKMTTSEDDQPVEVSQHYFLSEVELFCRLARERQPKSDEAPLCLEDASWLVASGGRGLADSPEPGQEERLGPEVQGLRLLGVAYQIWCQYLKRHTKAYELACWEKRQSAVLSPIEKTWAELKQRTGLYWGLLYWLGIGADWQAYEFCQKFNQHWDKFGPMASEAANDQPDGWNLEADVRDEGLKVTGRLGRALDIQEGRRCFLSPKGYVGLGPLDMQAGDQLVILKGASVPMILRKHVSEPDGRHQFKYIGEAYCYGIMDGGLFETRAGAVPLTFPIV